MLYDVIVVGGGIHGAGVAQAAATAGFSVAVLEQTELAAGTSSRSSKLIHGGLRYLEHGQLALVRECLREREILCRIAPDIVKLKPFFIPVYKTTRRRPSTLVAGLSLYAMLTGLRRSAFFHVVGRQKWNELDGLAENDLQAVFQYWDAQTDDRLLTRAVMRSAQEFSAELYMPAQLTSAQREGLNWRVNYLQQGVEKTLQARVIVNASGPWVNETLKRISPQAKTLDVDLIQGTHVVLDSRLEKGIYYLEAPRDGRAVFVMPWYGKTLVGTTEKHYEGDPTKVAPTDGEILYLLETLSFYFPKFQSVGLHRIDSAFAGLRVLPSMPGSAFSRPRETILHVDDEKSPSLLTIYGGKLTAYRATANKVVQKILPLLPSVKRRGDTATLPLRA